MSAVSDVLERAEPAQQPLPRQQASETSRPDPQLFVISCRPPDPQAFVRQGNSGGLVAALAPAVSRGNSTWIAGRPVGPGDLKAVGEAPPAAEATCYRSVGVKYPADLHNGFYAGLANGVLWPLYHGMLQDTSRCTSSDWHDYSLVNRYFASVAADQVSPGSFVWVHDYQLSLVPRLLREAMAQGVGIGFFLHTPFPSFESFRVLPWAREILLGMLGADLIGFHTESYLHNFLDCVERLLGLPCDGATGQVWLNGRAIRLRAVPVGIDTQAMYRLMQDPEVQQMAARLRGRLGGERLLLGVDRMDYTKGIDRRLEAVDQLFERYPEWRGRAVFAQIAVPSREEVGGYQALRHRLELLSGAINGRWGDEEWTPVRLFCRSHPMRELAAWYLAADVALVTPYRDGMNLVAKEYCAAHRDGHGVLVLSELVGAADELGDALLVNPYYLEGLTDTIHRALMMPREEACSRMRRLNQRIQACDARYWAETFLAEAGWY